MGITLPGPEQYNGVDCPQSIDTWDWNRRTCARWGISPLPSRDRRLDERREPRASGGQAVRRAEQCEQMGHRERGDDRHELPQAEEGSYQAEQKERMMGVAYRA